MASREPFSASRALSLGWQKYSGDAAYCWCVLGSIELLCVLSSFVISFHAVLVAQLLFQLDAPPPDSYIVMFLLSYALVRTAAQPVLSRWLVNLADGTKMTTDDLLGFDVAAHLPVLLKNAVSTVVVTLYTLAGTLILIVPGIVAVSVLRFYKYLVLEDDEDAITSLRGSYELSAGHLGQLVLLQVLSLAIKGVGLLLLVVGLVPASVVCGLAEACAFNELKGERHGS
jgi:hypothetical protein